MQPPTPDQRPIHGGARKYFAGLAVGLFSVIAFTNHAFAADRWQPLLPSHDIEIDAESIEVSAATVRGLIRQHMTFEGSSPLTIYQHLRGDCNAGTLFSDSQSATNADGTPTSVDSTPMALSGNLQKELLPALCERSTPKNSVIRSIAELRAHYGKEGIGRSDDELILNYAPAVKMAPYDLALRLGYELKGTIPSTSTGQQVKRGGESFTDRLEEKAIGGAVLGVGVTVLLGAIAFVRWGWPRLRMAAGRSAREGVGAVAAGVGQAKLAGVHPNSRGHDAYYVQAIDELDAAGPDKATWARALASSDGDDGRARANYIKLRVNQLEHGPKAPEMTD